MHDSDFHEALQRYARLRRLAYDSVEAIANRSRATAPVRLRDVDADALVAWYDTWRGSNPLGYGGWDWPGLVAPVLRRPAGFPVALWSGNCLCGLAVGRASARRRSGTRHTLSVYFLEGNPDPLHPLRGKVAPLALAAAEAYAALIGARRIRLIDPLPGVIRIYRRLGYAVALEPVKRLYLEKRIETDEI